MDSEDNDLVSEEQTQDLCREALGEPIAIYRLNSGRVWLLGGVGVLLLIFAVVFNILWWMPGGVQNVNKFSIIMSLGLPFAGASVLYHLYLCWGISVWHYPTGLLCLRRGVAESFPWDEVKSITLKGYSGKIITVFNENKQVIDCSILMNSPWMYKLGSTTIQIDRHDGKSTTVTAILGRFPQLAQMIQENTFTKLMNESRETYKNQHVIMFETLFLSHTGILVGEKLTSWPEIGEISFSGNNLSFKRTANWWPWLNKDLSHIPNPHVFIAMIRELSSQQIDQSTETTEPDMLQE